MTPFSAPKLVAQADMQDEGFNPLTEFENGSRTRHIEKRRLEEKQNTRPSRKHGLSPSHFEHTPHRGLTGFRQWPHLVPSLDRDEQWVH
jgi:hypothetical protein